jgi:hypothetical protein
MASIGVSLFEPELPEGFHYREAFITAVEEATLVTEISHLEFFDFEMRGVVARRRVIFFGQSYEGRDAVALPEFLVPWRDAAARWAGLQGPAFAMALVNEYQPGAPIGWHRDAPQYGIVAGISLLSACRMKFRPYSAPSRVSRATAPRRATHELLLAPRSAYLVTGPSRQEYEHSIPAVSTLRYSVTFRTLR